MKKNENVETPQSKNKKDRVTLNPISIVVIVFSIQQFNSFELFDSISFSLSQLNCSHFLS